MVRRIPTKVLNLDLVLNEQIEFLLIFSQQSLRILNSGSKQLKAYAFFVIVVLSLVAFTISGAEAFSKPVFYFSEEGSIKIGQEDFEKPKYAHEPTQLHISGKIEEFQRAESTTLWIKSPSGEIFENVIRPTREGTFDFLTHITKDHPTGSYEVGVTHRGIIVGPAIFKIFTTEPLPEVSIQNIPTWVKNNAKWWSEGLIGNSDFVEGIQYLINHGIIQVPPTSVGTETGSHEIPLWLKNNAGWWAQGKIANSDFLKGIQYLIQQGIIKFA